MLPILSPDVLLWNHSQEIEQEMERPKAAPNLLVELKPKVNYRLAISRRLRFAGTPPNIALTAFWLGDKNV